VSQADSGVLNNIMICPMCKKQNNKQISIKFIKNINSYERERECECGHKFSSIEKIKHIKKVIARTLWKDWRFRVFAKKFFADVNFNALKQIIIQFKLQKEDKEGRIKVHSIKKREGHIYFELQVDDKEIEIFKTRAIKANSIKEIIEQKEYWKKREEFLGKPINDMKISKNRKDEARQFENTLIHKENGIRIKKYDFKFLFETQSLWNEPGDTKAMDDLLSELTEENKKWIWNVWKEIIA
jgi:hypothetical protein